MRRLATFALPVALLAACSAEPDAPAAPANDAAPVTIALPAETAAFPATAAGELLTQHCTACHSADLVTRQPPLTAEKWQATVTKMREAYHAPLDPAQDRQLVAALLAVQPR